MKRGNQLNHGVSDVRSVEMWYGHSTTFFSRVLPLQYVKRQHSVSHRVSRLYVRRVLTNKKL